MQKAHTYINNFVPREMNILTFGTDGEQAGGEAK